MPCQTVFLSTAQHSAPQKKRKQNRSNPFWETPFGADKNFPLPPLAGEG